MLSGSSRPWERWDDPGIARAIDQHWRRLAPEGHHRRLLADFVGHYAAPQCRLLEVGCGSGYFYEHLRARLPDIRYTGVDTSREMLSLATARYPMGGHFVEGDAFALDFPYGAFDVVVAFEVVLGHLPDITAPLREMYRVCAAQTLFTIWQSAEPQDLEESIEGSRFLHREYVQDGVIQALGAIGVAAGDVERVPMSGAVVGYAVSKSAQVPL